MSVPKASYLYIFLTIPSWSWSVLVIGKFYLIIIERYSLCLERMSLLRSVYSIILVDICQEYFENFHNREVYRSDLVVNVSVYFIK